MKTERWLSGIQEQNERIISFKYNPSCLSVPKTHNFKEPQERMLVPSKPSRLGSRSGSGVGPGKAHGLPWLFPQLIRRVCHRQGRLGPVKSAVASCLRGPEDFGTRKSGEHDIGSLWPVERTTLAGT